MTQIYTYQSQLVRELRTVPNHNNQSHRKRWLFSLTARLLKSSKLKMQKISLKYQVSNHQRFFRHFRVYQVNFQAFRLNYHHFQHILIISPSKCLIIQ